MITTWAGGNYAGKEWAGTLKDFYAPRWNLFYDELMISLKGNIPWNAPVFNKKMETWEMGWTKDVKEFSTGESGEDVVALSKLLYQKYSD
jgi:alpha-N-acetylglucosaminidase